VPKHCGINLTNIRRWFQVEVIMFHSLLTHVWNVELWLDRGAEVCSRMRPSRWYFLLKNWMLSEAVYSNFWKYFVPGNKNWDVWRSMRFVSTAVTLITLHYVNLQMKDKLCCVVVVWRWEKCCVIRSVLRRKSFWTYSRLTKRRIVVYICCTWRRRYRKNCLVANYTHRGDWLRR